MPGATDRLELDIRGLPAGTVERLKALVAEQGLSLTAYYRALTIELAARAGASKL